MDFTSVLLMADAMGVNSPLLGEVLPSLDLVAADKYRKDEADDHETGGHPSEDGGQG